MTRRKVDLKVELPTDKSAWRPAPLAGPVVLVSTRSGRGEPHVARKTWLTMVASAPPMLALSCRLPHRTAINILETREFVVNVPGEELAPRAWAATDQVTAGSAADGWVLSESLRVGAPRVQECRAHLECVLDATRRVTDEDVVFFAKIVSVSLDESLMHGAPEDRYRALRSLLYLEPELYAVIENARRVTP